MTRFGSFSEVILQTVMERLAPARVTSEGFVLWAYRLKEGL